MNKILRRFWPWLLVAAGVARAVFLDPIAPNPSWRPSQRWRGRFSLRSRYRWTAISTEELRSELILREWEQAWVHSRHLEDQRRHYLGFFFTALLSVTALAGYLPRENLSPSGSVLTISALGLGLQMLSMYLFLAVSRVNEVLDHYLKVVAKIRDELPLDASSPVNLDGYQHAPFPQRSGRLGRLILWHGSEAVLGLAAGIFVLILAVNFIRAQTLVGVSSTAWGLSLGALLLGFVSCAFVFWLLHSCSRNQDQGEPGAL